MYIPKSQIKTDQYSNREYEYVSNKKLYTGPYWKTSAGKFFTGRNPNDGTPNLELQPVNSLNYVAEDLDIVTTRPILDTVRNLPPFTPFLPNEKEYRVGVVTRYFYRYINQPIFVEISKEDYQSLKKKDKKYEWENVYPFPILWNISGDKSFVEQSNKSFIGLQEFRQPIKLGGLYIYFQNKGFTELYR